MSEQAFVFPASYAQQRLWFLDQLVPGTASYNIDLAKRIPHAVDNHILERAINQVVERHESLRTIFRSVEGDPVQVILPELKIDLKFEDLSELPAAEREQEVRRLATEEARKPFDLSKAPLIRTTLLRVGPEECVFLLTMHHIVCDGWSMGIFYEELSALYDALAKGEVPRLAQLPIQYADFAVAQRKRLEAAEGQAHLAYWKQRLANLPVLRLPGDRPRPHEASHRGARHTFSIPARLHAALRALSQAEGVTMFMTLLAAFEILLCRYTGQEDIVVGTPVANRTRAEIEGLIGFFVNSLVLRVELAGRPTFRELLARVRAAALEAYEHQDLPFERIVQELHPERDASVNPLFQVSFQLFAAEDTPADGADRDALFDDSYLEIERGTAAIDFALDMWELPDGITGVIEYSVDQFNPATIGRMAANFQVLLEEIATDPHRAISEFAILTKSERSQVVSEWNATTAPLPEQACLQELFERQAEKTPGAAALVFRDEILSYGDLERRANQIAAFLRAAAVGPETVVGICAERSIEAIAGILGILKAGGAYMPLDPAYPKDRVAMMLRDARPAFLLTQQRFLDRFQSDGVPILCLDSEWNRAAACSDARPAAEVRPDNLCYAIYTSGTTGTPKGVMVEHRTVCNHLLWMQETFPFTEADRVPQKYSFSFDASVWEIFGTLTAGACLLIAEPGEHLDISALTLLMKDRQASVIDLVPTLLEALLDDANFLACGSLRRVIAGGERLSAELQERFFAAFDAELGNVYGPTEATIGAAAWKCRRGYSDHVIPIGRPAANTSIYLLDRNLNPVPIGVAGEVYIGGECLARGYLNHPDLTAEKFICDPFSNAEGARLYKTGDLARYLPDGNLDYLGRADHQVKLRGYRIELEEIEASLKRHPSVRACAVSMYEEEAARAKLVAYVVPEPNTLELWPSLGEYSVYDEVLYYVMTHDEIRNAAYRAAINRSVPGKIVLDIGTGADAVLARFCVEAGASHVYAIEVLEEAYQKARDLIARLGLSEKITVIHGEASSVELPQPVDVSVSEIVGTIGSSEGVIPILNDARRFLATGGQVIPRRSITKIAAVTLPGELAERPRFAKSPQRYVEEVFKKFGRQFDLRVCIRNFPTDHLASNQDIFEDLDFSAPVEPDSDRPIELRISKACRIHGFLLWLNLLPAEDRVIDVLESQTDWLPVFLPAFYPGLELSEGDVIEATASRLHSGDSAMPDYRIEGRVVRNTGETILFTYNAPYSETAFRGNPFYETLFRSEGQDAAAEASAEQVTHWREVHDEMYRQAEAAEDTAWNTAGWFSSYTGKAEPEVDLREQVDHTVSRILRLQPRRILEIGCGSGLLLFRIAPHTEHYTGTDLSPAIVEQVNQEARKREWGHVRLLERAADNFAGLEGESFDLVILNSVAQYFPSVDYTMQVLEKAIQAVAPGGHVFVGDVRSLGLLEAFHLSLELFLAPPSLSTAELRAKVRQRMQQEQELAVDPSFFFALQQQLGRVARTEIQPKRGWNTSERTRFRYDALMEIGTPHTDDGNREWLDWDAIGSMRTLRGMLGGREPGSLGIRGVPSARLAIDMAALRLLHDPECPKTVAELRSAARKSAVSGVEPEELWSLEEDFPLDVRVGWSGGGGDGRYDVLLEGRTNGTASATAPSRSRPSNGTDDAGHLLPVAPRVFHFGAAVPTAARPWSSYANDPLQRKASHGLVSVLRSYLKETLPEHMIPAAFVVMEELPLTGAGKVDRRALPPPAQARPEQTEGYVLPRNPAETALAEIWTQLLGLEGVGVHDNFFELGGDSILSIQVVARAGRAGLRITPAQLFQHQTIAELAAVAELKEGATAEQGAVSGPAGLTPIERWFFEQDLDEPHHYNQAVLFEVPRSLQADRVAAVLDHLLSHHDALRLRFERDGNEWQQRIAPAGERVALTRLDLSALAQPEQTAEIERTTAEMQASLNLASGPLMRAALFDLGPSRPGRLFMVIHHLAVDGVSWHILLEDFDTAYAQLEERKAVRLPAKTTSWPHWAERLRQYAQSAGLKEEKRYWLEVCGRRAPVLPRDGEIVSNTIADMRPLAASLSEGETQQLLQDVPKAYHTQINDALLAALVETFADWTGERRLRIDLEGHGREALFDGVDLSRTIGWFTTLFPVVLDVGQARDLGEALQAVKEQLRQIPNRGIGYGVLRYLSGDAEFEEAVRQGPQAEVAFNYLGQLGYEDQGDGGWRAARESTGPSLSPRGKSPYLIEINGGVSEGRLELEWSYHQEAYQWSTIDRLADNYLGVLRKMIRHCRSLESRKYTPSDFSKAKLSQKDLDKLISKLRAANR